jgi:hypothetical protein
MIRETFALSQKELQRVAVISACIKGEVACARAAELLCLRMRQIKRASPSWAKGYSYLNATMGSTRIARRAGTAHAASAMSASKAMTLANTSGSSGRTP